MLFLICVLVSVAGGVCIPRVVFEALDRLGRTFQTLDVKVEVGGGVHSREGRKVCDGGVPTRKIQKSEISSPLTHKIVTKGSGFKFVFVMGW